MNQFLKSELVLPRYEKNNSDEYDDMVIWHTFKCERELHRKLETREEDHQTNSSYSFIETFLGREMLKQSPL